jgi:hypothetical protein
MHVSWTRRIGNNENRILKKNSRSFKGSCLGSQDIENLLIYNVT